MSVFDSTDWTLPRGQRLIPAATDAESIKRTAEQLLQTNYWAAMARHKPQALRSGDYEQDVTSESSDRESDEQSSSSNSSSDDDKKKKAKKAKSKSSKKRKSTRDNVMSVEQLADFLTSLRPAAVSRSSNNVIDVVDASSPPLSRVPPPPPAPAPNAADIAQQVVQLLNQQNQEADDKKKTSGKIGSKLAFKRLDHVYDRKIHNYKLKETVKTDPKRDEWDQYVFNVRRQFDASSHFLATFVDIKSKILRDCLKEVMGEIKGINLVTEKPSVDPNMLFLYLEELRTLLGKFEDMSKTLDNKKDQKTAKLKAQHLKVLIDYLDEDFADTKKALYPMLEAGIIAFEYLWALFKPNTVLFSTAYGDEEEPRAIKTVYSKENASFNKGRWYSIEAQYLDYDGKNFGMATVHAEVPAFSGARKISTLPCYPIRYHKDPERAKSELIERGKKFVALQGMNYKTYYGMCYVKRDDKVLKVDVRGRVMIDPAIFRRVNPNYPLGTVRSIKDEVNEENIPVVEENGDATTSSEEKGQPTPSEGSDYKQFRVVKTEDGKCVIVEAGTEEASEMATSDQYKDVFTEEQLLVASPLVVGFSFSEKLWLEFAVSKISEVVWNSDAFDSLILPDNQKNIVKAMVSSHAFHPSRSIDDIIAGKGKGLVAVLHGGPGLGKTLTVESIADLLKRPLYMVSAGDLGTSSNTLERELQNILDIAHAWGAVLLLDEADVFLEKRSTHDIQRNALVSIFLRLLEYFQGILFLTTNRVDVFDDAFISRIHLSLRYGDLSTKAKKAVWKTFIAKVRDIEEMQVEDISDKDLEDLARRSLNGRQIKNIVRAAQALAIHADVPLGLAHIREVLGVAQTFERDLKGGTGYEEAMRGYT